MQVPSNTSFDCKNQPSISINIIKVNVPEFSNIPIAQLISKDYAKERRKLINSHKASTMLSYGDPEELSKGDTVYLTVADRSGNMISLIQSNFRGMGSGIILEDLGFVFNNRG